MLNSRGVRICVHKLHFETYNLWYYLEDESFTTIECERVFLSVTSPFTCLCPEKKGMPAHRVTSASPVTIFFFPMLISASCDIVPAHLYLNSLMVFWSSKAALPGNSHPHPQLLLVLAIFHHTDLQGQTDSCLTERQIAGGW